MKTPQIGDRVRVLKEASIFYRFRGEVVSVDDIWGRAMVRIDGADEKLLLRYEFTDLRVLPPKEER